MVFFSSCDGKKTKGSRTDTPTSGRIEFVADESFSPFIEEERQQFEFEYPKAHLIARYADDITGFKKLQDLKTCLFFTSRALKAGEVAYFKSKNLIPSVFPIGYDGLAFIVNRNNTDKQIIEQLRTLYHGRIYSAQIRYQSAPVKRSTFACKLLIDDTKSGVADDYRTLIREILKEGEN